jgi:hypothetical protein
MTYTSDHYRGAVRCWSFNGDGRRSGLLAPNPRSSIEPVFLLLSMNHNDPPPAVVRTWRLLDWEHSPVVYALADPTDYQVTAALEMIGRREVDAGALLDELPPPDRRWLAYEFRNKVVTNLGIDTRRIEALGWLAQILDDFTVWSPPPSDHAQREEFAADILRTDSRTIEVSTRHALNDIGLFGEFASNRRGGSSALMALSGASPLRETVLLRNPYALDLDVLRDADSLSNFVEQGVLSVRAVGASSGTDAEQFDLEDFPDPLAVREAWSGTDQQAQFSIVLQVAALVDPTVAIPPGHIFEQQTVNGVQTLAVATPVSLVVGIGPPVTCVIPAWCLNQAFASPAGQQIAPTPLRARYSAATSQHDVWSDRARVAAR